ncbi:bifunctional demethylmenaquinone methyltransferase/2-methoxy-6-polyprenyl-1,4-benzoquinol methylase UbiE [Bacteroidetes bacterium SCGC AAA795-G10]|nr:bifunctional demethylmenaquinone methyltransferase/2-methoxy-6-polyprenyl-1,4-benzoquinol methylase UbiE [Bacteroidetes bacterium SCGC AAA795-G10]
MSKKQVLPYVHKKNSKKSQVRQMFNSISCRYDFINRIISGGLDIKWRKNLVRLIKLKNPKKILDVATGTGDLAIALGESMASEIIGIDISERMLEIGKKKVKKNQLQKNIKLEIGDAERINYPANYFDAVTVSFGVRNFENLDKGLLEIYRVLKPGCELVILETSIPKSFPLNYLYRLYTIYFLPLIGSFFSKDKSAYKYLSLSAKFFPFGIAFNKILEKNRFIVKENISQTFGVATIYHAYKPM